MSCHPLSWNRGNAVSAKAAMISRAPENGPPGERASPGGRWLFSTAAQLLVEQTRPAKWQQLAAGHKRPEQGAGQQDGR